MRKLSLSAALLAILTTSMLSSVHAGMDVSVSFLHAPSGADPRDYTPPADSVITGTWEVVTDASASSYLKTFQVAIEAEDAGRKLPAETSVTRTYSAGDKASDRIRIIWDSSKLTRYNGIYRLTATATSHLGNQETAYVRGLKVNNPPLAPTGVQAEVVDATAVVNWKANAEPDLIGYRVLRSEQGGSFTQIGASSSTSLSDTTAPPRVELRYKVVAVRASPLSSSGVASAASPATSRIVIVPADERATQSLIEQPHQTEQVGPVEPTVIVGARRDLGYSPILPYSGDPLPVPAQSADEEPAQSQPTVITRTIDQIVEVGVYKPPFVAAALVLLVVALHLLRLAERLFKAT